MCVRQLCRDTAAALVLSKNSCRGCCGQPQDAACQVRKDVEQISPDLAELPRERARVQEECPADAHQATETLEMSDHDPGSKHHDQLQWKN